jgi:hypothetical protein
MDDDEIRDALGDVAAAPAPSTESFEAILRRSKQSRARLLGVALVVALVVGPGAGLLIGLNIDDGKTPVTVASGSAQDSRRDAASANEAPGTATSSASAVGSVGMAFAGGSKLEPLFTRTTADGIAIRAYRADVPVATDMPATVTGGPPNSVTVECAKGAPCPLPGPATTPGPGAASGSASGPTTGSAIAAEPGSMPAGSPECLPTAMLRAELSNQAAVDPGFVSVSKLAPDQAMAVVQTSFFGIEEGSPVEWVAVHTTDAVATVRVRFGDGNTDEMAPVQGYAVLAHQTAAPTPPDPTADPEAFRKAMAPQGTVEGLDGSGAIVTTADLGAPPAEAAPDGPCAMAPPLPAPAPDGYVPGPVPAQGSAPAVTILSPPPATTAP